MTWPLVASELGIRNVLGWVLPIAAVAAYFYLPGPFDVVVLLLATVTSGLLLLARPPRRRWGHVAATAWCIVPLGFIRVEAMVLEWRVQRHLADFEIAARAILTGKLGPCHGPIQTPGDCDLHSMPPTVQTMVVGVGSDHESVTFGFKGGTRRGLVYAPRQPAKQLGPYHPIAPGWFLSL
jgi:hypothetical protein